jgi:hypothetical protein
MNQFRAVNLRTEFNHGQRGQTLGSISPFGDNMPKLF